MEIDVVRKDSTCLEESINRLSDEHKTYFLGVLEGLFLAQNIQEVPALKPERVHDFKQKNLIKCMKKDTLNRGKNYE